MYAAIKEKQIPSSPRLSYSNAHRYMPRHAKGYLWLLFLVLVFGSMLLSDNGLPVFTFLPTFGSGHSSIVSSSPTENLHLPIRTQTEDVFSIPSAHEDVLPSTIFNQPIAVSSATPISTPPAAKESSSEKLAYGTGSIAFTPDDVVILFKTGATSLWRRVPIHLSTTLADTTVTPNVVFYSDHEDHIAGRPIIDVLANVSDTLKQSSDFELYRNIPKIKSQNLYLEHAAMEGDHYLPGGWRLDKYKFLPLVSHAATYHPGKKWYIYMEDDNYYFWHSLYTWLGTNFDPSKSLFLGSPAARLGEDFAHGGSGFIISGAAMNLTFGSDPDLAHKWEDYARDHCCGDQVLSHVMAVKGVPRDRRYDHTSFMGLQALPTWRMAFGVWNWCSPLFNIHKVHQSDISNLHVFEKQFHSTNNNNNDENKNKQITYSTLFTNFILPTSPFLLHPTTTTTTTSTSTILTEWNNFATERLLTSNIDTDEHLSPTEKEKQPWFSTSSCEQACVEWEMCLTWKYSDDTCGLSSTVAVGSRVDEGVRVVSGFLGGRIRGLVGKVCDTIGVID